LFVENCNVDGPLNDAGCPWCGAKVTNTGRFKNWDNGNILKNAPAMLSFSPVYRTYDVSNIISIPTTLDRVTSLLEYYNYPEAGGLINCEDEPYIGAGLGCALGIMRYPRSGLTKGRFDEVVRAVRWQRIAPAFPVKTGETVADTTILIDEYIFKIGETWVDWIYGQKTKQLAPAKVARGMNLPTVISKGEKPFVICSRNPSGAVTVATLPRLAPKGQFFPLADVSITIEKLDEPIGVFGRYKSLTVECANLPVGFSIFAQDLAGDKAIDITDLVEIKSNKIILSGKVLEEVGLSAKTEGDVSEPGLMIVLKENKQ